jgi:hypothetical protein
VTVTETRTLAQTLDSIERQLFSWTWAFTPEQARAVGGDIRDWAARENFALEAEHQVAWDIRWWAFDVS